MNEAIRHIDEALSELTDFQLATVKATCARFGDAGGAGGRVLVADEVGLGKTLVARGVIASLLKRRLESGISRPPFRVVYICSNLALAHENVKKLAVFRTQETGHWVHSPSFGRLAELGIAQEPADDKVLMELCSLTPATSFSLTQGDGNARERYIIWCAVKADPYITSTVALEGFFRKDVVMAWDAVERDLGHGGDSDPVLESSSLREFHKRLSQAPTLDATTSRTAREAGISAHSWRTLLVGVSELGVRRTKEQAHLASHLRARIREMYAECCAQNLRADLFILDEFQRFRELLDVPRSGAADTHSEVAQSEQHVIAKRVLHQGGSFNTLLLSATPFKALSHLGDDEEGQAHAHELTELLKYLSSSDFGAVADYQRKRETLLKVILSLPSGPLPNGCLDDGPKAEVQQALRNYICRTERAGVVPDIGNVLQNVAVPYAAPSRDEIATFIALDQIAESLKVASDGPNGTDVMQFHKAAPWCLSFLGGYQLRNKMMKFKSEPGVAAALKNAEASWIPHDKFRKYGIDLSREAPSARFKQVLEAAAPPGAERLLWIPPSLGRYAGSGPFADRVGFSKTLLFSGLVLAPRALSSYVSYECERRLLPKRGRRPEYFGDRSDQAAASTLLSQAWSLAYPSERLASVRFPTSCSTLDSLKKHVSAELSKDYRALVKAYGQGRPQRGSKWYTLAPLLLDWIAGEDDKSRERSRARVGQWFHAIASLKHLTEGHRKQVPNIMALVRQPDLNLGQPPDDLFDYLVDLAIAGPGVCMMRSLVAAWPELEKSTASELIQLLGRTSEAALAFVEKMNRLESQRVLQVVCPNVKPWIAVARYGAMGNLQAMLDEYVHLLKSAHSTHVATIDAFLIAIGVGSVTVTAQTRLPPPKRVNKYDVRFHCHYAVPLGNQKGSDEKGVSRITNVRAAFNSPFWPFMLNSTSIGQEGLDFHWYCRRIVHWSLPSNPIDLEQREGRINRYKSLVVRQRIAQRHGLQQADGSWTQMFERAKSVSAHTDLIPFWHVPAGSIQIERVVPSMPFSNEVKRLDEVLRILSLYRLSFGQPRQQELVENLLRRDFSEADLIEIRRALLIDLAPVNYLENQV
jgi:hypothetical protein